MPKGGAGTGAKVIARDRRKNAEARKMKVKTQGDTVANENEVLKMRSSIKKHKNNRAKGVVLSARLHGGGLNSMNDTAEEDEGKEEVPLTVTQQLYDSLVTSDRNCLTMQPRLIEEDHAEGGSDGEGDELAALNAKLAEEEAARLVAQQTKMLQSMKRQGSAGNSLAEMGLEAEKVDDGEERAYQDSIKERWYNVRGRGKVRYYWDLFILICALYSSVVLPFSFSFNYIMKLTDEPPYSTIQNAINGAYVVDIIVGFLTSYIDPFTGDEYYACRKLVPNYLKGNFTVDFLSTFWFYEAFAYVGIIDESLTLLFKLFRMLKVLRLGNISKLIRDSQITVESKGVLQVLYVTLVLVIYTHVVACIMWHMLKTAKMWTPAVDFGSVYSSVFIGWERVDRELPTSWDFFVYEYGTAWYNSLLAFSLVEINPRTDTQIRVMCAIYILNAIVNAVLFGVFFDQFEVIRRKETMAQAEIDQANTVLGIIDAHGKLKDAVRANLKKTFMTKLQQEELTEFFSDRVTPSLRRRIVTQIFKDTLMQSRSFMHLRVLMREGFRDDLRLAESFKGDPNVKAFTDKADTRFKAAVRLIAAHVSPNYSEPEQKVLLQNADSNGCMYFILNGVFDVQTLQFSRAAKEEARKVSLADKDLDNQGAPPPGCVRTLGAGDYFGEAACIFGTRRSATVAARNYGTYGELDQDSSRELLESYPTLRRYLWGQIMSTYDDELTVFLRVQLGSIDYLQQFKEEEPAALVHLAFVMEAQQQEAGDHLFQAEDVGVGEMVIVFDGLVELYTVMDNGTEFCVERLSKGSIINAHTFLADRQMAVNARFASNTTYYTLSAERFGDVAAGYPALRDTYFTEFSKALAAKERQENALDYSPGQYSSQFDSPAAAKMTDAVLEKAFLTHQKLKNATMYYIARNRKDRKVPKLKDVLMQVIAQQADRARAKRDKLKGATIETMMEDESNYLTEEQEGQLREQFKKIGTAQEENQQQLSLLSTKVTQVLRPREKPGKIKVKRNKKKKTADLKSDQELALNIFQIDQKAQQLDI